MCVEIDAGAVSSSSPLRRLPPEARNSSCGFEHLHRRLRRVVAAVRCAVRCADQHRTRCHAVHDDAWYREPSAPPRENGARRAASKTSRRRARARRPDERRTAAQQVPVERVAAIGGIKTFVNRRAGAFVGDRFANRLRSTSERIRTPADVPPVAPQPMICRTRNAAHRRIAGRHPNARAARIDVPLEPSASAVSRRPAPAVPRLLRAPWSGKRRRTRRAPHRVIAGVLEIRIKDASGRPRTQAVHREKRPSLITSIQRSPSLNSMQSNAWIPSASRTRFDKCRSP